MELRNTVKLIRNDDDIESALAGLVNPLTGRIPLEVIYEGEDFYLTRDPRYPRSLGLSDQDIEGNHWLTTATETPFLDRDRQASVQRTGGLRLMDCVEYFTKLRHNPRYHLSRADFEAMPLAGPVLHPYLTDSNYIEPYCGSGGKTEALFDHANATPKQVVLIDTQSSCLNDASGRLSKRRLIEEAVKRGRVFDAHRHKVLMPEDKIVQLQGDWKQRQTYVVTSPQGQRDVLDNLKADTAQAFCGIFGTANNVPTRELFGFCSKYYPATTLYGITYDLTTRKEALELSYNELVNQLIISGITGALRKKGYTNFDPRRIASDVLVTEEPDSSLVTFRACTRWRKFWYDFDLIEKKSPELRAREFKAAGIAVLTDFRSPKLPDGYDLRFLCAVPG